MHSRTLLLCALTLATLGAASGQSVISAHAGVVHYFEGVVLLDDQPLEQKFGAFAAIKIGSTLRTEEGRAEILLSPGMFLRLDEHSAIRMLSNILKDTEVEIVTGSAILDSGEALPDNHVVLFYKDFQMRFPKNGVFRFDADPVAVLQTDTGEAEVTHDGRPVTIDAAHLFFFDAEIATKKFDDGMQDEFYQWAQARREAIAEDSKLAQETARDPADVDDGLTVPLDPGTGAAIPDYGSFGLGGYGGNAGSYPYGYYPFGYSAFGANVFSPFAPWGSYPLFPILVTRYYRVWQPGRWPARPGYPVGTLPWSVTPHYQPSRTATPAYRPLAARPAYAPLHVATPSAPHVVGHR